MVLLDLGSLSVDFVFGFVLKLGWSSSNNKARVDWPLMALVVGEVVRVGAGAQVSPVYMRC